MGYGSFGHEVINVVRPVLNCRVANSRTLFDDDFDDRAVQRVGFVNRCRAALDVVDVGVFVGDDQRSLELSHVLGVDAEIRLKRDLDVNALGNVNKRTARPDGRVERCKLVVARRDDRSEVLPEKVFVLTECRVGIQEQHTLLLQVFPDLVVDDFGLVLRRNASD